MVGKKSHTKKKLRKEMTAAIGDEEEYVKEKKKVWCSCSWRLCRVEH
jgi:hypothetical protein